MKNEHGIAHSRSQGLIDYAYTFAKESHSGQKRKYTNEPYIVHPIAVAHLVSSVTDDCDMIAAAFLHDVVEDTHITIESINNEFGWRCAQFVQELTEFSNPSDGNRKYRKELDKRYLSRVSFQSKTIKLADLIDNTKSILKHDAEFSKVYMAEKKQLLSILDNGDERLFKIANDIVCDYYEK